MSSSLPTGAEASSTPPPTTANHHTPSPSLPSSTSTASWASRKRRSETILVTTGRNDISAMEVEPSAIPMATATKSEAVTTSTNTASGAPGTTAATTVRVRVRLKRIHGVAAWSWNAAADDVCGICQTAFEGTSPGVKFPGEDCPVVWGKCHHAFHLQCISKWLTQPSSKNSCPICRREWEFGSNPVRTENPP